MWPTGEISESYKYKFIIYLDINFQIEFSNCYFLAYEFCEYCKLVVVYSVQWNFLIYEFCEHYKLRWLFYAMQSIAHSVPV
jgi:hypothetical protein